ncbi:MAG: hypothetical protein A2Z14_12455 [Chloroflexi bacterium RBG_16_48_8]|nr:MAG: hypothetical protein A2Z14_12455 [Chloroflexi bacterium RBG_16_48_8]
MTSIDLKRKGNLQKAQGLVELALVLPVMLLTMFVLIEFARVFHAWMAVENGARMGLRYATTAELNEDNCASGGSNGECNHPDDEIEARVKSIHPLIVPILQSIWPHIQLSARRDGRV